jgi:aryl-alcohol dehydrogenase-like predicted oxidoreductase
MEYRLLGPTGLRVSGICLGTMQFKWTTTEAESYRVLDAFMDAGGNLVDTADIYTGWVKECKAGTAETIIGKWMKRKGNRRRVVLATKCMIGMWKGATGGGLNRSHIVKAIEDSLKRLRTDHVDLLQSHWPDWSVGNEETLRAYRDLIAAGKVRFVGCSNYSPGLMAEALVLAERGGLPRYVSAQPKYNLLVRDFEEDHVWLVKKYNVGVIPYSPLQAGLLSGKYRRGRPLPNRARGDGLKHMLNDRTWNVIDALDRLGRARGKTVAQMALGWLLSHEWMTSPIVGPNTVAQLNESLGAAGLKLSEAEMKELDEVSKQS